MTANQQMKPGRNRDVSETSILLFSFITAFSVGVIIISALFLTIKKLETRIGKATDISYLLGK